MAASELDPMNVSIARGLAKSRARIVMGRDINRDEAHRMIDMCVTAI